MPDIAIEDVLFFDAETRSALDLRKVGSWRYCDSATTDVWMVCWAIGDGPIRTWWPGEAVPAEVMAHARQGRYFSAHNIGFEYPLTNLILHPRYEWPRLEIGQLHDTAAEAAAMALPRSLEEVGAVLGLPVQKDKEGHALMLRMSRPRRVLRAKCPCCRGRQSVPDFVCHGCDGTGADFTWWDERERLRRLEAYCAQDVATAREVFKRLRHLPPDERIVWEMDQMINERGVRIDVPLVRALQGIVVQAKVALDAEMAVTTRGAVKKCSNAGALVTWLNHVGAPTSSVSKAEVAKLLADPTVPEVARRALQLRRTAAKSSTAKLDAMLASVRPDDRQLRGMFVYHGANTGRWSCKLVQLHNLIRKSPPGRIEDAVEVAMRHGYDGVRALYGDPMGFASSMLRPCLIPDDGDEMYSADLSQIEARMVAALAGQQDVLDIFASGQDVYCHAASGIFGREITKHNDKERQVGKVSTLSLGYQGGPVALSQMAKNYNLDLAAAYDTVMEAADEDQIERAKAAFGKYKGAMSRRAYLTADLVKQAWRVANPEIVAYWGRCQHVVTQVVDAFHDPKSKKARTQKAGKVTYWVHEARGTNYLWARLPSGRLLCYTDPKLVDTTDAWNRPVRVVQAKSVDSRTKRWTERTLYGGLLVENCLAGDTDVLTRRGWIPLARVRSDDWLWDGVEWVRHDGVVCKGMQRTLDLSGVRLTGDHRVLTTEGWRRASSCEGLDRAEVRTPDLHRLCGIGRPQIDVAGPVRLRHREDLRRGGTRQGQDELVRLFAARTGGGEATDPRHVEAPGLCGLAVDAGPLPTAVAPGLGQLWRAGHHRLRRMAGQLRGFLERYGTDVPAWSLVGSRGQRRSLLPRQLPLDNPQGPVAESTNQYRHRHTLGPDDSVGSVGDVWCQGEHLAVPDRARLPAGAFVRRAGLHEPVYDLVNAGPRQRFTVRGEGVPFIVHNCTQAAARDVLVAGMLRLVQAGYTIAGHVHDEAILTIAKGRGDRDQIRRLMTEPTPWMEELGLPVDADVSPPLSRYRK